MEELTSLGTVLIVLLVFLGISIGIFLLLREVNNWYWKINERIALQKETNALLKKLVEQEKDNKQ